MGFSQFTAFFFKAFCKSLKNNLYSRFNNKMYKCLLCDFETCRLTNFERHKNRKTPCRPQRKAFPISENIENEAPNGMPNPENILTSEVITNDDEDYACGDTSTSQETTIYNASTSASRLEIKTCQFCQKNYRANTMKKHLPGCRNKLLVFLLALDKENYGV